jgi:D-methionine transport system ATP-binding protein
MIEFQHVNKTYKTRGNTVSALKDVNLTINDGEIYGVIGFSGAGKSTLLRMVNALEKPSSGKVIIDGQDISTLPYEELRKTRKKIGMVFQSFNLLESRTVFENIELPLMLNKVPKEEREKRVNELLQFVSLTDRKDAYPSQLSGGQKQRVGIARALATNPSILLSDEATSALDPDTTEQILQLLKKVNEELHITILFVTHEIDVIQKICDHVAVMEQGRVVEQGSVLDVFSDPKQAMTKRFVSTVIPNTIPKSVVREIKKWTKSYKLYRLRFLGPQAAEDGFFHMNRDLNIDTNILFGSVTELQGTALGLFIISVIDENGAAQKAEEFMTEHHLMWKEIGLE